MANTKLKEEKLKYNTNLSVGIARKNMNRINRHIREVDKKRGRIKDGVKLSMEDAQKVVDRANMERELGIVDYCKCYKGNRLATINKFLHDTSLQPKERLCYRYVAIPTECKGKLRDKSEVRVRYVEKKDNEMLKDYMPFVLYYKNKRIGKFKNQKLVIKKLKELIGLYYD